MSDNKPSLAPCEYKTGRTLGQGSYATVKEAYKISTGERFAVKVISKKLMQGKEHLILNEIDILKKVSKGHPNIVTLYDYFETPNNLYLVMDLCTGGELFDRICERGSFYEEDASFIVHTLIGAVEYLHSQNIVHRDIKPENLLMRSKDSFEIVIADFGLSKLLNPEKLDSLLKTTCGTPGYMPPEVIRKLGHGKPVDMWCIGVLTYFLLCGYMPFDSNNDGHSAQEVKNILAGKYDFDDDLWDEVSDSAKNFIKRLLIVEPLERMTASEALKHPWLQLATSSVLESSQTETPVYNTPETATLKNPIGGDLLPNVKERFNARRAFLKAFDVIKAVHILSTSTSASTVNLGHDQSVSPMPGSTAVSQAVSKAVSRSGSSNKLNKPDNSAPTPEDIERAMEKAMKKKLTIKTKKLEKIDSFG